MEWIGRGVAGEPAVGGIWFSRLDVVCGASLDVALSSDVAKVGDLVGNDVFMCGMVSSFGAGFMGSTAEWDIGGGFLEWPMRDDLCFAASTAL